MIQLHHITLGYGKRILVRDFGLSLPTGSLTALLGRNGSGKSTLLRAIAGLHPLGAGSISVMGRDIKGMDAHQMALTLAFVTTERVRIANLRCEDLVALGRAPYTNWMGRLQDQDRVIVAEALATVGMSAYAQRTLDRMSDGECQRIMIARALAQQTPVLLLDEPTSFLDVEGRQETISLLKRLSAEQGKTVLFSTHEVGLLEGINAVSL